MKKYIIFRVFFLFFIICCFFVCIYIYKISNEKKEVYNFVVKKTESDYALKSLERDVFYNDILKDVKNDRGNNDGCGLYSGELELWNKANRGF